MAHARHALPDASRFAATFASRRALVGSRSQRVHLLGAALSLAVVVVAGARPARFRRRPVGQLVVVRRDPVRYGHYSETGSRNGRQGEVSGARSRPTLHTSRTADRHQLELADANGGTAVAVSIGAQSCGSPLSIPRPD